MKFSHPDAAIRVYASAIERSGVPSRSVVSHGREYEKRCNREKCKEFRAKAIERVRRENRRRADECRAAGWEFKPHDAPPDWIQTYSKDERTIVYRCAYCRRLRQWDDAYILGGEGTGGKKGRPPGGVIRVGDVANISRLIERMGEEIGFDVAAVYVRYAGRGKSMDLTASDCTEERIGGRGWSEADVRRCVRRGRQWTKRGLSEMGLFERPGLVRRVAERVAEWNR